VITVVLDLGDHAHEQHGCLVCELSFLSCSPLVQLNSPVGMCLTNGLGGSRGDTDLIITNPDLSLLDGLAPARQRAQSAGISTTWKRWRSITMTWKRPGRSCRSVPGCDPYGWG
jgi:hypothetical protein